MGEARTVAEWKQYAEGYPRCPLTKAEAKRPSNPDVTIRSHYLCDLLVRLMELEGAPSAAIEDLKTILQVRKARSAPGRARAQAEISKDPSAPIREIARRANYDAGEISAARQRRLLRWPT